MTALGMDVEKREYDDQGGGFDEMVRLEVMRGRQLVEDIEQKMKLVPMGCLSMKSYKDNEIVRVSLMGAAAAIVTSFSNVITFLNSTSTGLQIKGGDHGHPVGVRVGVGSILRGDQLKEKKTEGTRPPSPQFIKMVENLLHHSPPVCSTATPPQSPKNRIPSTKRSTPSPRPRNSDIAPAADKLCKSDCMANLSVPLDLNDTAGRKNCIQARMTENVESTESEEQNSISKRRKCMPKWTVKMAGSNTNDQGTEAAPEDSFTWRKYGQKEIFGSRHPRSYYRCSHKRELGCPAIKYVQKSDDHNSPEFHVTYKGDHTCHSRKICSSRPCPYSSIPAGPLQDLQSSLHVNSSCLTLSSSGSLQVGQCGPTFSTTKDFQLRNPFVSSPLLSNSTENELSKSLIFKPMPSFQLPDLFANVPKFGIEGNFSSLQLQPKNFIEAVNPGSCNDSFLIDGFDSPKMTISQAQNTDQSKQNENTMLRRRIIPISEADVTDKLARSNSTNLSRDTRESFKQLMNHLCLDEKEVYDSSADNLDNSERHAEQFLPTTSEVMSNPLPLEGLQSSFSESKPLAATKEVVAEHVPSSRFEIDFILDSPGSQKHLLDLQYMLFEP